MPRYRRRRFWRTYYTAVDFLSRPAVAHALTTLAVYSIVVLGAIVFLGMWIATP